ncbi:hypothetical protein ACKUB1_11185 [Methanospirillum stamsii]|uniref:IPT/TIG domain-containing protein n=1 Tax=Methanospirillum stamsii TaxID=1277351 RepID=A0A2V2N8B2_9EURY|nr:hypothetical protein [Methanospirillum stamsii]PWR72507.1 hypothetical protein DLD82_11910 [Methanospirillum stamsii]
MNGNKKNGIITTTAVPEIIFITPSEGSAGTKTQISILGTNFGNKSSNYSTADIAFYSGYNKDNPDYFASGRQDTDYNENEIINWTDTQIEVNVPFGYLKPHLPKTFRHIN